MKPLKRISTGVAPSVFLILAAFLTLGLYSQDALAEQPTPGDNYKIPEYIMTPNVVNTRHGELSFHDGLPDQKTLEKVYDNFDFMRGVDVTNIRVSTFSDEISLSNNGAAKVFGVSVKDRGAVTMAGHAGKAF